MKIFKGCDKLNLLNEIISAEEIKKTVENSKVKCNSKVRINKMILRLAETYNSYNKSYISDIWLYGGDYPIGEVVQKELEELKEELEQKGYCFRYKHSASELFNDGKLEKATYSVMLSFK